jgi:CheY-like chemotaxis protein
MLNERTLEVSEFHNRRVMKSLVEMHGGTVEATSDGLGKNSEFTDRFPTLSVSDVAADEADDSPDEPKSYPCHRILIVDDLPPAAFIYATLLRSLGQRVSTAENGAEALKMIERETPDLILSDISMPVMNGYDLAQEIRRRPEWNDIYLVAVTGYGQEDDKRQAWEAGFDNHVLKPISKEDLEHLFVSSIMHKNTCDGPHIRKKTTRSIRELLKRI